ncbi:hypothetical protein WJX81_002448 [Elliptochloris bilobata]|uniref:CCHC-type domain-containing protein n=1 Tax=Elliptochloris bilobata TaxID=381761 RepID=A0AAW1RV39_9CHLO
MQRLLRAPRAEGGCEYPYARGDLALARCLVCGRRGHLSCGDEARRALPHAHPSCSNCGEGGHTSTECARDVTPLVRNERLGARMTEVARFAQTSFAQGGQPWSCDYASSGRHHQYYV